ncbi:MAG: 3-deoxy-7-phosphoheptulonate synthase [Balneolales bacterium]|nr:3-deoxy-7-phosphoheptulonate synthase [Balneolales bacterium]
MIATEDKNKIWTPNTWREKQIWQMPEYDSKEELNARYEELKGYPPLVTSWEIEKLRTQIADASNGHGFVMQGGDCAESFDTCNADNIVKLLKVLLQMSFILIHEMNTPVTRIGRIAGQYAKPRSSNFENVNGLKLPSYRGDLFNSFEPNEAARRADPARLVEAFQKSSMTLNFVRSLTDGGGFADMHHPEYWELDFMKKNQFYAEYKQMVESIHHAIHFVEAISPNKVHTLKNVDFFTSHEALNLYYDAAQTRRVPHKPGYYNLSTHMPWIGNRTRQLDGAHVEYMRGIRNPIGVKVGPPYETDEILKLIEHLNPNQEEGRITLITRFGKDKVQEHLPGLIRAVNRAGFHVLWSCDPMHGNTYATNSGVKTRAFNDILDDIKQTFEVHRSENTILGGVHLEMTGGNVTECVGGANGLNEEGLGKNYLTYCDPRLNYEQALEMAFLIAREWKISRKRDTI